MTITIDYTGKLVLITGGGRGIGLAISTSLAKAGADIALTYTSKDATEIAAALTRDHNIKAKAFKCDVADSSAVAKAVEDVEKHFGKKVDIGIANAGITLWKSAISNTDEEINRMFAVNTIGPFYVARQLARSWLDLPQSMLQNETITHTATRQFKKLDKQILFVSSISGLVAMYPQQQTAYNASKAGLTMLAKSLAAEWAPLGITVNAISPGYVASDMISESASDEVTEWSKEWHSRTPIGRFATPAQIGDFVALLLSNKQGGMGFMTGSNIVVDGGYTLY